MNTPVNLNKYRKARTKAQKARRTQENTVTFGRTSAEKKRDRDRANKASRDLDAHHLAPASPSRSDRKMPEPDA